MKIFLDSASLKDIEKAIDCGLIDGVTTNPSLIEKEGKDFHGLIKDICTIVQGSISAEVLSNSYEAMIAEGMKLGTIAPQVTVKVPLTPDGIRACAFLRKRGIQVNVTLCFSVAQGILAAKAGATYLSPFLGRLDDVGSSGEHFLKDLLEVYSRYPQWNTQVLAASIRSVNHVIKAAQLGVHVITIPWKILNSMFSHPLTDIGIDIFNKSAANIMGEKTMSKVG